jgi:hypothetical protein
MAVEETDEEVRLMRAEIAADPSATSMLDEASPEMAADDEFAFAHNLATLPLTHKNFRLYTDDQLRKGIEYPTEVGPVDILAVDEQGNFIVFELKLTRGPDKTIGQLLRYMGWIKANLAKDRDVYGVIVAKDVHEKLRYAALLVPSVSLLEYEVDFRLKAADLKAASTPA